MMEAASRLVYERQALSGERNPGVVIDNEFIQTVQNCTFLDNLVPRAFSLARGKGPGNEVAYQRYLKIPASFAS